MVALSAFGSPRRSGFENADPIVPASIETNRRMLDTGIPHSCASHPAVRVIAEGDRFWSCEELAESVVNRLLARYGPELTTVFTTVNCCGVERRSA
jgi:hypothetical protein